MMWQGLTGRRGRRGCDGGGGDEGGWAVVVTGGDVARVDGRRGRRGCDGGGGDEGLGGGGNGR